MKLSISTKQDAIKDGGGLNFIAEEGVFPVSINFLSVEKTRNGALQANFNITYNGNTQTIYGPTIQNTDGATNTIGMSLLNKMGVLAGFDDGFDLTIEKETHKVGKDQTPQEFDVITDFSDMDLYMHVVREYTRYNNEVRRNLSIRNVFSAENMASASEIASGVPADEVGKQYKLSLEKYCVPVYRDGVTAEEAAQFEADQAAARAGNKAAPSPTSAVVNKKSRAFGAPR